MSESRREYLDEVRRGIQQALCLLDYPSPHVVGYTKPVIETEPAGHPLMAAPVVFSRSPQEACLIEHSINASRISFKFQVQDDLERCILATYLNHVMQRAEDMGIVRRVAVPGYDVTFLITYEHLTHMQPAKLIEFLMQFLEQLGTDTKAAKLALRTQGRKSVAGFWSMMQECGVEGP